MRDIERIAKAVRGHWGVESMHWLLDVEFKDDLSRYWTGHGAKKHGRRPSLRPRSRPRQQTQGKRQIAPETGRLGPKVPNADTLTRLTVNLDSLPRSGSKSERLWRRVVEQTAHQLAVRTEEQSAGARGHR